MSNLHESGFKVLADEAVDSELLAIMSGRAGRTTEGIVTYLIEVDD